MTPHYHFDMKCCFKCGAEKPLSDFYKHPQMSDGHVNKCKECNKKDVRENRAGKADYYNEYDRNRPNHKERVKKISERVKLLYNTDEEFKHKVLVHKQKWLNENQHKRKAHYAVNSAKRAGKLNIPESCEHCESTEKKIQAHHWSYDPEHWLDVVWLCTECHGKEHKRLNELNRDPDRTLTKSLEDK